MKKLIFVSILIAIGAAAGPKFSNAQVASPGTGTIHVSSNIPTSWLISGPNNFAGSGTTATYDNVMPSGADYFINFPTINGYQAPQILPSISQTLNPGATINWSVFYQVDGDTTVPPTEPSDCYDNSAGSVVAGLPTSPLAPGQEASFTIRFANTGTTVWHHGAWYYGLQKTNQNIVVTGTNPAQAESIGLTKLNPPAVTYPQGYDSWGPTADEWTMKLTAPTTPGAYSMTFQMYYDGTDTLISDYKQTPETRPYPCILPDGTYAIQQPSTFFGQPVTLNFTVAKVLGISTGTISVHSNIPTNWTLSPANGSNPTYQTTGPSTIGTYTASPDTYTLAAQTIPGYMTVITSSANNGATSNSSTQTLSSGGTVSFNINYLPAIANLTPSSKNLISVTSARTGITEAYTSHTVINSGDTLTFQVTLINDGNADAQIQSILDVPSDNLTNLRNVYINKGSGFTHISNSGNTINVSGLMAAHGNNWLVKYDMTVNADTGTQFDQFKNCATVNYSDGSGNKNLTRCFGPILFKDPNHGAPTFREVGA